MINRLGLCISLFVLFAFSGISVQAQSGEPTPQNSLDELVNLTVQRQENACRSGEGMVGGGDPFATALSAWVREPELCSCVASRLRRALRLRLLVSPPLTDVQEFITTWSYFDMPQCVVPYMKERLDKECIALFTNIQNYRRSTNKTNEPALNEAQIGVACDCAKTYWAKLNVDSWVDLSAEQYSAYLARKAGRPFTPKPNSIADAFSICISNVKSHIDNPRTAQ